MSIDAGEILSRVEREGVPPLHVRRLQHAAAMVRKALDEAMEEDDQSWLPFAEEVVKAGRTEDWESLFSILLAGYRRLLIEREPDTPEIRVPETLKEWDQLPDVLSEFDRRYKIAE